MPKTTVSVISAVLWRLKTEFKKEKKKEKKERKKERRKEKLKHWLKQKLKRLKVTGIRKKNRRNVQKKIADTAKGFGGGQTKKERKINKKRKKEKKRKKKKKQVCQQHPVFPGGHPSKY